ncbi:FkbM family methyltransferase [Nakamurella lactea]|uniref:FkbM family methyltransferase n=1 Tax=Nakamurella lactea TaxID=459515 RepID=UPI000A03FA67|nr:FkbM family methyltransferase [Nakamurella lactea]
MTNGPFVSYAQNREDVVLHRALGGITKGRYIDIGANDPEIDSVTRAFYDTGWRGITVEPVHAYAERHREQRPEDLLFEVAVTAEPTGTVVFYQIPETGLSTLSEPLSKSHEATGRGKAQRIEVPTRRLDDLLEEAGWDHADIHFMSVDVEGAEGEVLKSIDLDRWRPWIIVAEALEPDTTNPSHEQWEPPLFAADYRFGLFDGLSRFYIAGEHWDELHDKVTIPANVLDNYELAKTINARREITRLNGEVQRLTDDQTSLLQDRINHVAERDQLTADRDRLARRLNQVEEDLRNLGAQLSEVRIRERTSHQAADRWKKDAEAAKAAAANSAAAASIELHRLQSHANRLQIELQATHETLSWKVTKPLRVLRRALSRWSQ